MRNTTEQHASASRKTKRSGTPSAGPAWKFSIGLKPHSVTAFERMDKGGTVWLRWTRKGQSAPAKKSLGFKLRDEFGRKDAEAMAKAQTEAKNAYNRLLKGEDPRDPPAVDEGNAEGDTLTMGEGLRQALLVPDGMFAVENDHVKNMRRCKKYVLMVTPEHATWSEMTGTSYETLWRKLAHLHVEKGVGGKRTAELAVVLVAQTARWLKRAGKLAAEPTLPEENWGETFKADWARITKVPTVEKDPPRHTPEELGRLFSAIDSGLGDPRIRLALATAGEARLGQAIRCDRSLLDLSAVGAYQLGRFTIPHCGKKKGTVIDLTPELRAYWDAALYADGYLADLEQAFVAGHIRTYPLFPQGRLRNGKAKLGVTHALGKRGALDMFHELEGLAGVANVPGRGWFGIRRVAADLAEDVQSDNRALNAITGHQSDEMRRRIYQQKLRDQVLGKAADTRTALRSVAVRAAEDARAAGVDRSPSEVSAWQRNRLAKQKRRLEQHPVPTGRKTGGKRAQLAAEAQQITGARTSE